MAWLTIITCLALFVYLWTSLRVGLARGRLGVAAPATTGNEEFERYFRVHQNTMEQLVVFLPALWMFGILGSKTIAAALGAAFVIGRIIYAITYVADPKSRTAGFLIGYLATVALVIGALVSAVIY